jgi:hypothetical protein
LTIRICTEEKKLSQPFGFEGRMEKIGMIANIFLQIKDTFPKLILRQRVLDNLPEVRRSAA